MLWRINYNNFAHTAHHIRRVYLLRKALTFLFFRYESIEIGDFLEENKKRKSLISI